MNYLTAILRNQFNLFYSFGYTFIPSEWLIEFIGDINEEISNNVVNLFNILTPFKYDEEYVILHMVKEQNSLPKIVQFDIQNLIGIYPLSAQAKFSIESKIDSRIKLKDPIFESKLDLITFNIYKKEIVNAISALWLIAGYNDDVKTYMDAIGIEHILAGINYRKECVKANKIRNSNYWSYLLAYDRYDFFPNNTLGYFYDAGQVFAYSKGHESFEGSGLFKFLEHIKLSSPQDKFHVIKNKLESDQSIRERYISQTSNAKYNQYIIAPLFLMLKDEIRDSEELANTKLFQNLTHLKDTYGEHFKFSLILLGAFFGYEKFYDVYYDKLNLRFYKTYKALGRESELISEVGADIVEVVARNVTTGISAPQINNVDSSDLEINRAELVNEPHGEEQHIKLDINNSISARAVMTIQNITNNKASNNAFLVKNKYQETLTSILKESKGEMKLSDLIKHEKILSMWGKKTLTNTLLKKEIEAIKEISFFKKGNVEMVKLNSKQAQEANLFNE